MIDSYNTITLYIAITDSTILNHILGRNGREPDFTIDSFIFSFKEDFCFYGITYYVISLPYQIVTVGTVKECGPQSNLNLVEFVWNISASMKCKMFAIAGVPFHNDTSPRILYVKHHQAARDDWMIHSLCSNCRNAFKMNIRNLVSNCNLSENCTCNLCLRQPPSLRGLTSHFVLNFKYNIEHFSLTHETTYDKDEYANQSINVPLENLIPNTFPKLICKFTQEINRDDRLHID